MRNKKALTGKKILVTGGCGFVGSVLVKRLKDEEAKVIVLDAKTGGDLRNWETLASLNDCENLDLVYHLAALSYVPYSWEHPREVYETNVIGTLNILEFCRQKRAKQMVFISSYVYGQPKYLPVDEAHPVEPAAPYNWSKHIAEGLCQAYAAGFGIKCVILRPFNVYGIGQNPRFLIPTIIDQAVLRSEIVLDDPRPKRDLLYLDDMVEALVAAGRYVPKTFEVFNIGYGRSFSIEEIVIEIARIAGKKIEIKFRNRKRKGEILDVVADISKAKQILKWQPEVSLAEGLKRICAEVSAKR